ncbi:MAG: FliA/WhiG family RNA polymerase sigma factor [Chloroflexi bacterium]|nr:FliA/WhiG family RNA polymerase sigma factor [Chloroflexota bacterium]
MDVKRDDSDLIQQYCASREGRLREEIILRYVPLVHYVLGRLGISQSLGADYEDAASQGLLGLIEAVDRYDPSHGAQFSTYATLRIRGKAIDHLRAHDWLSRGARKRARIVQDGISTLWETLQRTPTDEEIASHLDMDVAKVQQALVDSSRMIVSLDAAVTADGEEETSLHELLPGEDQAEPSQAVEDDEMKALLAQALRSLPEREQMILSLYYYDELTFKEIGEVLSISESRVCQLHSRMMTTLKAMLNGHARQAEPTIKAPL